MRQPPEEIRELASLKEQLREQTAHYAPVTDPPGAPNPLDRLLFDAQGSQVTYRGEDWPVERLARADPQLAAYAADLLASSQKEADKNNRACALLLAPVRDIEEVAQLLAAAKAKSDAAVHNEGLLPAIRQWLRSS
jgi:hypothetical protein